MEGGGGSETKLTASILKEKIKTTQNIKKNAFESDKTRQTANFPANPLFQCYEQYKNKNKQSTYLLPVGFLQKDVYTRLASHK